MNWAKPSMAKHKWPNTLRPLETWPRNDVTSSSTPLHDLCYRPMPPLLAPLGATWGGGGGLSDVSSVAMPINKVPVRPCTGLAPDLISVYDGSFLERSFLPNDGQTRTHTRGQNIYMFRTRTGMTEVVIRSPLFPAIVWNIVSCHENLAGIQRPRCGEVRGQDLQALLTPHAKREGRHTNLHNGGLRSHWVADHQNSLLFFLILKLLRYSR